MKVEKSFIKAKNCVDKLTPVRKNRQKLDLPPGASGAA
jgi:hypothetical protein